MWFKEQQNPGVMVVSDVKTDEIGERPFSDFLSGIQSSLTMIKGITRNISNYVDIADRNPTFIQANNITCTMLQAFTMLDESISIDLSITVISEYDAEQIMKELFGNNRFERLQSYNRMFCIISSEKDDRADAAKKMEEEFNGLHYNRIYSHRVSNDSKYIFVYYSDPFYFSIHLLGILLTDLLPICGSHIKDPGVSEFMNCLHSCISEMENSWYYNECFGHFPSFNFSDFTDYKNNILGMHKRGERCFEHSKHCAEEPTRC